MSVSAQETVFHHVGNGATVTFAFGCQVLKASDLQVYLDDAPVTTGVTIDGIGSTTGGTVTFSAPPANLAQVRLERDIVLERLTDYQQNGDFLAKVVNPDFNRLWMALQQHWSTLGRALLVPKSDKTGPKPLPSIAARANKLLSFDEQGNPIAVAPAAQSAAALALQLASNSGSSLIGFLQAGAGAIARTLQAKAGETLSLSDWAIGDGAADDSDQIIKAISFAQAIGRRLVGASSANYRITKKISIATAGNIYFDGCGCLFTNAIPGAVASDSIFEISNQAISNVNIGNFRVNGEGNNGHVVAVLGQLSTGPQFITVRDIWVQGNAGNGKDRLGNAMPAQLLYAYGGMTVKVLNCVTYQSGGVCAENVLKLHIWGTTIDSPPAGRLVDAKNCNNVVIDGDCVLNGGTGDQIDINGCISVKVMRNRLKGGGGRQFYAHGRCSSVAFEHNQQEVYDPTSNAVEFTTAVQSPLAVGNTLAFVNANGTPVVFTKGGIAIVDEPGGGFISMCPVIESNSFIINSLMTIEYLIGLIATLNAVQRPRVSSNVLAAGPGGTASTIKNGVLLSGVSIGPQVDHNQYGATAGNTMVNGINVSASVTGAYLLENYNAGNCTNPVVDATKTTTRREGGVLVPISWTPVVEGATAAGAANYSARTASYTRDGNLVTFSVNVTWDSHTGTGSMVVPIPFTTTGKVQMLSVMADSVTFTGQLAAAVSANGQVIRLWAVSSNGALAQQNMDPNGSLFISGIVEIQ